MITGLNHLHSSLRYVALLFIILSIVDALSALMSGKEYQKMSKMFALVSLITVHTQLLLGLLLYFMGDKGFKVVTSVEGFMSNSTARFFAVEHIIGMIAAITLITIGYSNAKRMADDRGKYRTTLIFYSIALLIVFAMIPWPFMKAYGSWI